MTYRITRAHIEGKCETVNALLGFGRNPESGTIGSIEISGAYGGYGVHQIANESRGVSDLMGGHYTMRECARFLDGMIAALRITTGDDAGR